MTKQSSGLDLLNSKLAEMVQQGHWIASSAVGKDELSGLKLTFMRLRGNNNGS